MWTGSLAFGLVNVPVKMYAATEDHAVRFHQVHLADGGRIRMQRVCSECGQQVAYRDIGKGYEDASGRRVVLRPEDFEELPEGPRKEVEILQFVPSEQVDPILFDNSYYLQPDGPALKPYVLLRRALQSTERTAIAKVAIRQRTQLAALRVHDDVLVLQTMLWPDEVREPDFDFLGEEVQVRDQELQMAQSLISNLSDDFHPEQYADEYREAVLRMIEAKLAGGEGIEVSPSGGAAGTADGVVDLMDALKASVARTAKEPATPAQRRRAGTKPAGQSGGKVGADEQSGKGSGTRRPGKRRAAG